MRWAIIGATNNDSLEFHLKDSLTFLGHEAKMFDLTFTDSGFGHVAHYWLRRFSDKYDILKAKRLAHQILEYNPDIVLGTYRFIHPLTIAIIKAENPSIIAIHLNPDALVNLEQQQIIASNYDFLFTKDPYMQYFLKEKANLNAYYLPEAFNPRFHKPPVGNRIDLERKEDIDILIFGNMYPYRVRIIQQVIKMGYKVKLYGIKGHYFPLDLNAYFMDWPIIDSEKSQKIWGSKIVLNCFHYAEIEGVNCKYFEINGIGGFQICDYKDILQEYSPVNSKNYTFNSMNEGIELIDYYLANPEKRYEIAETQRKHFLLNHTYENRIESILKVIHNE